MISREFAERQIGRLKGLDGFQFLSPPALNEVILALMIAHAEDVAQDAISLILADMTEYPKPAEIRRIVNDANARKPQLVNNCPRCGGSTFLTSYWLITHLPGFKQRERLPFSDIYSYHEFCRAMRETVLPPGSPRQEVLIGSERCGCKPKYLGDSEQPKRRKAS